MAVALTKETFKDLLAKNDTFLERSLIVLYDRQTADEKSAQTTAHENGRGFNGTDAFILTSFAQWAISGAAKGIPEGKRLSTKQKEIARRKLTKYTGQLIEHAKQVQATKQTSLAV